MIAGKVAVRMFPRPAGVLGFESDELANVKDPHIFRVLETPLSFVWVMSLT